MDKIPRVRALTEIPTKTPAEDSKYVVFGACYDSDVTALEVRCAELEAQDKRWQEMIDRMKVSLGKKQRENSELRGLLEDSFGEFTAWNKGANNINRYTCGLCGAVWEGEIYAEAEHDEDCFVIKLQKALKP